MKFFVSILLCAMCLSTFTNSERISEKACRQYLTASDVDKPEKVRKRRIVGGEPAETGEFQFMAALGYYGRSGKLDFDCSGVIISDSFILSAAHCLNSRRPDRVLVGTLNLIEPKDTYFELRQIERIVRHPEFTSRTKKNDIGLIQLVKPIHFTNAIKPICLETNTNDMNSNIDLMVSGWGLVSSESRDRSSDLLKAKLKTVPLSQCNSTFLEFNKVPNFAAFRNGISGSQYCAHDPNGISDTCQGDGGSPLIIKEGDGETSIRLVGISSFGISCKSKLPSIYTRVASYVDWIESVVWPNGQIS